MVSWRRSTAGQLTGDRSTTALAAIPSPRPVKPMPSVLVAETATQAGSTPSAAAITAAEPRRLGDGDGMGRGDREPGLAGELGAAAEQVGAADAPPALVGGGEVESDVAEARGAEDRVAEGVTDRIAVGVALEAGVVGHDDPAEHERPARHQPVGVDAVADAHRASPPRRRARRGAPRGRPAG